MLLEEYHFSIERQTYVILSNTHVLTLTRTHTLYTHTHTHIHKHKGRGLDGSNEVRHFGQNHLESFCPWSTYYKRFPDFGLTSRTESIKEWNVFGRGRASGRSERSESSDRGSARVSDGNAGAMITPRLRQQSVKSYEEKSDSNDSIEINNYHSNLTTDSKSVVNENVLSTNKTESNNQVGNRGEDEKIPTKIYDIKYRKLREISVNLISNSSRENAKVELETVVEFKSKADAMYTFDNSLDYIHSEVSTKNILHHVMRKNVPHLILLSLHYFLTKRICY